MTVSGKVVDGLLIMRKIEVKTLLIIINILFITDNLWLKPSHWHLQWMNLVLRHNYMVDFVHKSTWIILVWCNVYITVFKFLSSKFVLLPPNRMFLRDPTTSPSSPSSSHNAERCDPQRHTSSFLQLLDSPQQTSTHMLFPVWMPCPTMHTGGHNKDRQCIMLTIFLSLVCLIPGVGSAATPIRLFTSQEGFDGDRMYLSYWFKFYFEKLHVWYCCWCFFWS